MKIFLSWSGERSQQAAEVFENYLPKIFPNCEIFHSPEIEKGAEWFSEIMEALRESDIGIICLTKENIFSEWVLFETGAMAIGLGEGESRACPFLLDHKTTDVSGPIAELQLTENSEEDIRRIIETINNCSNGGFKSQHLASVCENWVPQIMEELNSIEKKTSEEEEKIKRDTDDLLEEVLKRVRNLEKAFTKSKEGKGKLIRVTNNFRYEGKKYSEGDFGVFPEKVANSIVEKGYGKHTSEPVELEPRERKPERVD